MQELEETKKNESNPATLNYSDPAEEEIPSDDSIQSLRIKTLTEAAKNGDSDALTSLIELADKQGNVDAQFNLGTMYDNGQGVPQDRLEASKWYLKAAEWYLIDALLSMDANSVCMLGKICLHGYGIKKNEENAAAWFNIASNNHHKESQCELGKLFLNGIGVTQDYAKAFNLFKESQEFFADSQFYIGYMYYIGRGEKGGNYNSRNVSLASVWIKKAANNGSEEAKSFLMDHAKDLGAY